MMSISAGEPTFAAPLLDVRGLHTRIRAAAGEVRAVDGVDLSVREGTTLGIVGESGCGKSMTALSIMGLLPQGARVAGGTIHFAGKDLVALDERALNRIRGREIGMVFQDPTTGLHPSLSIGTQIGEVLRRHRGLRRRAARERTIELLREVDMPHPERRVDDYPHHLSGGMRQRAMIAMAIACEPRLLIADEPTTALDVSVQAGILDLLHAIQERHRTAILLITHDMGVVAQMADEVLVMYAGQVVERASAQALFDGPEHPYTEALLGALPDPDAGARRRRLTAIPGRPPVVMEETLGCRFAPRCRHRELDDCASAPTELVELRDGHWVRSRHPASCRARAMEPTS